MEGHNRECDGISQELIDLFNDFLKKGLPDPNDPTKLLYADNDPKIYKWTDKRTHKTYTDITELIETEADDGTNYYRVRR